MIQMVLEMNESEASGRKVITDLPKAGLLADIRESVLDYQDVLRSQLVLQLFSNLPNKHQNYSLQ